MKTILDPAQIDRTLKRLAYQLIENHAPFHDTVILGLQPRGVALSQRLVSIIRELVPDCQLQFGLLDITFYRDDVRKELHVANKTDIPFSLSDKKVVLVDDVLYTGRTIRAALDAILDFGRPGKVELCVLVDRRFNRELPIQPDYCGQAIDSLITQKVLVNWEPKEEVILFEKP